MLGMPAAQVRSSPAVSGAFACPTDTQLVPRSHACLLQTTPTTVKTRSSFCRQVSKAGHRSRAPGKGVSRLL